MQLGSALLTDTAQSQPDNRATDCEDRNQKHSGHPTAPTLMSSCFLDQLRTPAQWYASSRAVSHGSRNLLDDLNELIAPIPMMSGEADKFTSPFEHCITVGRATANGDAPPSSEFDEPFVS